MAGSRSAVWELVESVAIAVILALLIRLFLIQPFYIPSGSMEPTLQVGDRIIVNKLSTRFRDPERGQVLVFKYPLDISRDYIKRVVGLPGETFEIRQGRVYIDGQLLEEDYLPGDLSHSDYGPVQIPEHSYFMLGDNRGNSQDSRVWGALPDNLIVGRAVVVFWPLNRLGSIR
ncbi:MAG TPA: signal peptidase I [Clostridia bacterium]|nr:signal peptidase I [Clostridia bacterium]